LSTNKQHSLSLPAHDREALALLYALKTFRHFLIQRRFEMQTDNAALSQIFTSRDLSDLYCRWYHKLAEFPGMVIKHRQGQKLYCADALSRRRQVAGDNTDTFFVEPGVLFKIAQDSGSVPRDEARHATEQSEQEPLAVQLVADSGHNFWLKVSCASEKSAATTVVGADKLCGQSQGYKNVYLEDAQMDSLRREWPALYEQDADLGDIWRQQGDDRWGYYMHQGLLWKFGAAGPRLCVPTLASKVPFLQAMHDSKLAAHAGVRRTLARAVGNYYWRGMHADVMRYVETCHICQTAKEDRRKRAGDPRALQIPEAPWDVVHLDWISEFQKSAEEYDSILVFVDALTGMVHLQACKKT
jgi:hypothetical protein